MTLRIDPSRVEDVAKELYIRALKMLPPDVKRGFDTLVARETDATARSVLGVMVRNIAVAEETDNLLCQDTGIPIYNVTIGRDVVIYRSPIRPKALKLTVGDHSKIGIL